jgi:hypothetical protein
MQFPLVVRDERKMRQPPIIKPIFSQADEAYNTSLDGHKRASGSRSGTTIRIWSFGEAGDHAEWRFTMQRRLPGGRASPLLHRGIGKPVRPCQPLKPGAA